MALLRGARLVSAPRIVACVALTNITPRLVASCSSARLMSVRYAETRSMWVVSPSYGLMVLCWFSASSE